MTLSHFYEDVHGWFGFKKQYEDVAENIRSGDTIVELGSFYGRSAAFLAVELENRNKNCRLVCIDTFCGSEMAPQTMPDQKLYADMRKRQKSWLPNFEENMRRGGVFDLIETIQEDSASAARHFKDRSVQYVMVDAAHDYKSVCNDMRAWLPKLKDGGILMGDDYSEKDWPGVVIAAREMLPLSQIQDWPGPSFRYINSQPQIGVWRNEPTAGGELCFIPFVNSIELLKKAVESIRDLWPGTVVIDQSAAGLGDEPWLREVSVIRVPHKSLTFSQTLNWIRYEAWRRGADTFFFMHNDAELLRPALLDEMRAALQDPKCGGVFAHYDALAAFRTDAWVDTGAWDEAFSWYWSDVDYYTRMKLRGWALTEWDGTDVLHHASATLKTDPAVAQRVHKDVSKAQNHYRHKWGGLQGSEKYTMPYNGRL